MKKTLRLLYYKEAASRTFVTGLYMDGSPTKSQRAWLWFTKLPRWKKLVGVPMTVASGMVGYVGVCTVAHVLTKPYLDAEFGPDARADSGQRRWDEVEPELQEGDILLMMGNSTMSWKICNSQFVHSLMRPAAIRYSHVALVVAPMQKPVVDKKTGRVISPGHGALIYEVMDNTDAFITDFTTKTVKTMCPQIVEASDRIFARDVTTGEPCYTRLGVRRLVRVHLQDEEGTYDEIKRRRRIARDGGGTRPAFTPAMRQEMHDFIKEHEDYLMDDSPKVMLAFAHPIFATTMDHRRGRRMTTCSELIEKLFIQLGIAEPRNPSTGRPITPRAIAPYQFANGLEDDIGLNWDFVLQSEERIPILARSQELEEKPSVINRD